MQYVTVHVYSSSIFYCFQVANLKKQFKFTWIVFFLANANVFIPEFLVNFVPQFGSSNSQRVLANRFGYSW